MYESQKILGFNNFIPLFEVKMKKNDIPFKTGPF